MTETAAPTSSTRETLADVYVVDADVHIHEDPAALAEYAEPPWDVALREIAKVFNAPAHDVRLEKEATERAVKTSKLSDYRIVHFAREKVATVALDRRGEHPPAT